MMMSVSPVLALVAVSLTAAYFKFIYRRRRENEPPLVPGNILFGNGVDFAQHAIKFLHKTREQFGDIFTLRLLNQYITIVMDPHSYENVVRDKAFDFEPIQHQVNMNVFSFELANSRKMLGEAGKKVNGRYIGSGMKNFAGYLSQSFAKLSAEKKVEGDGWGQDGLRAMISKTLFDAIFHNIFGHDNTHADFQPSSIQKHLDRFHQYFNYLWLGVPIKLFPKAITALKGLCQQPSSEEMVLREGCSDYIKCTTQFMKENLQTEQDIIGHNLVYLHVNYNTFRLTFWCAYHLLSQPAALKALSQEIRDFMESSGVERDEQGRVHFSLEDIEKMPVLDSITKEAIRVNSGVFVIRYVSNDTDFEMADGSKHAIRKGDRIAVYPPAMHMDPEIFEEPEVFKYDRFVNATFYKNGQVVKNPVIGFGFICPGKRYSLLQAKWYLINLVANFDVELLEGETTQADTNFYGHEILPPTRDVQIRYRLRDSPLDMTVASRRH